MTARYPFDLSQTHTNTYKHLCQAVKGYANTFVSPAAQADSTGAAEATNAEGAQQAIQGG